VRLLSSRPFIQGVTAGVQVFPAGSVGRVAHVLVAADAADVAVDLYNGTSASDPKITPTIRVLSTTKFGGASGIYALFTDGVFAVVSGAGGEAGIYID